MSDPKETTHNGDENVVPITTAKAIMQDPAAAAGQPAAPLITSPHITDPGVQNLLNQLPGLVGAIDHAIRDTAGKPLAFMLMVFAPGGALHACNGDHRQIMAAAEELITNLKADQQPEPPPGEGGPGMPGDPSIDSPGG